MIFLTQHYNIKNMALISENTASLCALGHKVDYILNKYGNNLNISYEIVRTHRFINIKITLPFILIPSVLQIAFIF